MAPTLIADWGLPLVGEGRAALANGAEETADAHSVMAVWGSQRRYVESGAVGVDPIVGMSRMDGRSFSIEAERGQSRHTGEGLAGEDQGAARLNQAGDD